MDNGYRALLGTWLIGLSWGAGVLPAWAQTRQLEITLNVQPEQTIESLLTQAESLARSFIEQSFATDLRVSDVSVQISAERSGQEVPFLFSSVSRADWQREPNLPRWATYFRSSVAFLGYGSVNPQLARASGSARPYRPVNPQATRTTQPQPSQFAPQSATYNRYTNSEPNFY